MVVRLIALAAEVYKVTSEVGSWGEQMHILDFEGVWYELVWNVNGSSYSFC
jgi:hypothetical protein